MRPAGEARRRRERDAQRGAEWLFFKIQYPASQPASMSFVAVP